MHLIGSTPRAGDGQSLPAPVQAKMEGSFGTDLSGVRVHQDGRAEAMGAVAFAQGTDLHFSAGAYDPSSASGQELIGHEVAHVVQQRAGRVSGSQAKGGDSINADPTLEAEADREGAKAARGERASIAGAISGGGANGSGPPVQRKLNTNAKSLPPDPPPGIREQEQRLRLLFARYEQQLAAGDATQTRSILERMRALCHDMAGAVQDDPAWTQALHRTLADIERELAELPPEEARRPATNAGGGAPTASVGPRRNTRVARLSDLDSGGGSGGASGPRRNGPTMEQGSSTQTILEERPPTLHLVLRPPPTGARPEIDSNNVDLEDDDASSDGQAPAAEAPAHAPTPEELDRLTPLERSKRLRIHGDPRLVEFYYFDSEGGQRHQGEMAAILDWLELHRQDSPELREALVETESTIDGPLEWKMLCFDADEEQVGHNNNNAVGGDVDEHAPLVEQAQEAAAAPDAAPPPIVLRHPRALEAWERLRVKISQVEAVKRRINEIRHGKNANKTLAKAKKAAIAQAKKQKADITELERERRQAEQALEHAPQEKRAFLAELERLLAEQQEAQALLDRAVREDAGLNPTLPLPSSADAGVTPEQYRLLHRLQEEGAELTELGVPPEVAYSGMGWFKPDEASPEAMLYKRTEAYRAQHGSALDAPSTKSEATKNLEMAAGGERAANSVYRGGARIAQQATGMPDGSSTAGGLGVGGFGGAMLGDVLGAAEGASQLNDARKLKQGDAAQQETGRVVAQRGGERVATNLGNLARDGLRMGRDIAELANDSGASQALGEASSAVGMVVDGAQTIMSGREAVHRHGEMKAADEIAQEADVAHNPAGLVARNIHGQRREQRNDAVTDTVVSAVSTVAHGANLVPNPVGAGARGVALTLKVLVRGGRLIRGEVQARKIQEARIKAKDGDLEAITYLQQHDPLAAVDSLMALLYDGSEEDREFALQICEEAVGIDRTILGDPHVPPASVCQLIVEKLDRDVEQATLRMKLEKGAKKLGKLGTKIKGAFTRNKPADGPPPQDQDKAKEEASESSEADEDERQPSEDDDSREKWKYL